MVANFISSFDSGQDIKSAKNVIVENNVCTYWSWSHCLNCFGKLCSIRFCGFAHILPFPFWEECHACCGNLGNIKEQAHTQTGMKNKHRRPCLFMHTWMHCGWLWVADCLQKSNERSFTGWWPIIKHAPWPFNTAGHLPLGGYVRYGWLILELG